MHSTNYADQQLRSFNNRTHTNKIFTQCYESINIYIKRLINIRNIGDTDNIYNSVRLKMIHHTPFNDVLA